MPSGKARFTLNGHGRNLSIMTFWNSRVTLIAVGLLLLLGLSRYAGPSSPALGEILGKRLRIPAHDSKTKAFASPKPPKPRATVVSPVRETLSPSGRYPLHTGITATVFWIGEPKGGGSSKNNALSAWDDEWQTHYGGVDDPVNRNGYYPAGFIPKENPFYLDLPYNDFDDAGTRKADAFAVVPWAGERNWDDTESMMKNRWVKLERNGIVCYGQVEDAGPYEYNDIAYVFGTARPRNRLANYAGLDVSPALRDCLKFTGLNNDLNKVNWQFVDESEVPPGPWKEIITSSQIYWP